MEGEVIEDAKFQYLGCPGSAASGSMLTLLIKGKTVAKAKKITEKDILGALEGLPGDENHCAELAINTLHRTLKKFENDQKHG